MNLPDNTKQKILRNLEALRLSFSELGANKLRTFLTMLGIVFGIASVIAMLSIGEGARMETLEQIELLGTNNIVVKGKKLNRVKNKSGAEFSPGLSLDDVKSIKDINPFVKYVLPQREGLYYVTYKSELFENKIIGTNQFYPSVFNSPLHSGIFFNEKHLDEFSNVCVIGWGIKEKLFKFDDAVNKFIKVDEHWFRIIGVLDEKIKLADSDSGLPLRDFNMDIYLPITTMIYKMNKYVENPDEYNVSWQNQGQVAETIDRKSIAQITVSVTNDENIIEAANLTKRILKRRHYGNEDFEVIVPEQLLAQKQKTQRIFNIVMGAIASISLLVGGIGIMNIMLANILERTKEIGIRRAVGANKADLLSQFLYEALIVSVIGGLLGVISGFILTSLITSFAEWKTVITPYSVILSLFVSLVVGLAFGIYPAKKAADKNPIDALRYE